MTNPAAVTMSIGLLSNAPLSWFLHRPLDNFILTWQLLAVFGTQSSGQLYRDTEILPTYQDFAKTHANPDTDGNSLYHRAVVCNNTFRVHQPACTRTGLWQDIAHSSFIGIKFFNKSGLWNLCHKPPTLRALLFVWPIILFHLDTFFFNLYFTRLAPTQACRWQ